MTGIENADPVVDRRRRNELVEAQDFTQNYRERLRNIKNLGISWVRFGAPYSTVHTAPGRFDFALTDDVLHECRKLGLTVVADLLHFGLPDWLHEGLGEAERYFQGRYFPEHFARYAFEFAKRYPHIRYFTPVNEPYVTAMLSAKLGKWNEQINSPWEDDRAYVRAVANIAKAAILARQAIDSVWETQNRDAEPIYFQNDSFEVVFNSTAAGRLSESQRHNLRRFAPLDLLFGRIDTRMREYLTSQGLSDEDLEWFLLNGSTKRTILGIDHYPWCVGVWRSGGEDLEAQRESYILHDIIVEYWRRYPLPLMHMEVNGPPETAVAICKKTFESLARLREEGFPVVGMSWYGDELQIGWQNALAGATADAEYRVGLFYKGKVEPVGRLYASLAEHGFPPTPQRDN